MKKLFKMFWSFFKIGAFTFGGGYAMIPLIEDEVVNKNKWLSKDEFMDILVISQSLPGAIAINTSTFIGYKVLGIGGAIVGLLGVALPAFLSIILIAKVFVSFRQNYYFNLAFKGVGAAVPMLVLVAVISLFKNLKKDVFNFVAIIVGIVLLTVFNVSPVIVIVASALIGIVFFRKKV